MWQTIANAISEVTGQEFVIRDKHAITGGDINLAYKITNGSHSYFVKINQKQTLDNFEQEAYSLKQLSNLIDIKCPLPLVSGTSIDKSFLVIEYLNFNNGTPQHWFQFGQQLAQMHQKVTHGEYGWQEDNYIGQNLQPNPWQKNWSMFFAEQRIGWQLQLLEEKSIKLGNINHICQHCHDLLVSHHPRPSLLHGDLWQGNVSFSNNTGVIFDPACYYGDRETDIAMTELFGQFPSDFYQGYQTTFPLQKNYEQRKPLYNFYHVLNHANMFGGVYIDQAKASLHRILSTVH
ncbi:fructosamine kinase family protein [Thalassotalea sp. M1531]|uniref:Fructosamine kinase family protein n=1 Tax=Thalassotalea algicola TaxID=2716224 RepID=A0A7Y0LE25_9GAMM|nr:fructosamine kinase family protein [Thalassotalea algicola]NMP32442.1 fructosamine kinase family protein [Thalassotalea algicola]